MKINFENDINFNHDSQIKAANHERTTVEKSGVINSSSFRITFGDSANVFGAYSEKKGVEDIKELACSTDVKTKRDYLSVMSLSMSDEDYAEMVRTGQPPEDMDAADSVTIMDDIKTALIKGGTYIAGYTDTIDAETIENITGSTVAAQELIKEMKGQDVPLNEATVSTAVDAINMAKSVLPLSDSATQYLIENRQPATIQNIYHASYSGKANTESGGQYFAQNGYLTRVASETDYSAIMPQIEDALSKSGLENSEEMKGQAIWLINHGIPLTTDTLMSLNNMSELRNGVNESDIVKSVAIALSAGIPAKNANLTYSESVFTRAEQLAEDIENISDAAVSFAVKNDIEVNIRNLKGIDEAKYYASSEYTEQESADSLRARRMLEEVRLNMTVEANRLLLRSNFQIDIAPMEDLIEALKQAERQINSNLFANEDASVTEARAELFKQVKFELKTIPQLPASILSQTDANGEIEFAAGKAFTLHDVYVSGTGRREAYLRAGETYEALMTSPRADMGDSIKKAFRNVDNILDDLNVEINDENRRAVRILGYNTMEITADNIAQVREADTNLRNVLDRLTPARVISMIREDVNPLNMSMEDLNDFLNNKNQDAEGKAQNYARFLLQLEKQGELTELERDSYIGIYRMIASLDRTDDAAVGSLLQMGSQTTFANLLSAMRTAARGGIDVKIDESFGGVDGLRENAAIDEQINAAFSAERYSEAVSVSDETIEELISSNQAVSLNNLEALELLKNKRGDWFRPVKMMYENEDGLLDGMLDETLNSMTDTTEAVSAYNNLLQGFKDKLSENVFQENTYLDVKMLQTSMRQISVLQRRAEKEEYDFPALINGEATSIRLQIIRNNGAGELAISLDTESMGRVVAQFYMKGKASGYIAFSREDAGEQINTLIEQISETLSFVPESIYAPDLNMEKLMGRQAFGEISSDQAKEDDISSDINNTELYRIARKFISTIKSI